MDSGNGKSASMSMLQANQQTNQFPGQQSRGSKQKIDNQQLTPNIVAPESKVTKHSKGSKKEMRPLSGGISQKHFASKGESRSRVQSSHHNLSMFDKIGAGSSKIQMSPPGPIDFNGKSIGSQHLKPVGKISHNQSFDSIQVQN
mgnify:CR=1 FL=1